MPATPPPDHVDVYPVGALADLRHAWRYLTIRSFPGTSQPGWAWRTLRARAALAHLGATVARHIRNRQWRDLKNTFNGYLAEPYHWPTDGTLTRCGSGWTPTRAMRSLTAHGWPYREPTSWTNGQPRYRHPTACPWGQVDGWGGPLNADPQAPGHRWYECPHAQHPTAETQP